MTAILTGEKIKNFVTFLSNFLKFQHFLTNFDMTFGQTLVIRKITSVANKKRSRNKNIPVYI
jgi:hypothetical protein